MRSTRGVRGGAIKGKNGLNGCVVRDNMVAPGCWGDSKLPDKHQRSRDYTGPPAQGGGIAKYFS